MWEVDMKSSEWDADCVDSQSGRGRDEEQKEANKFLKTTQNDYATCLIRKRERNFDLGMFLEMFMTT